MKRATLSKLLSKFNSIHESKYDYSEMVYLGSHVKIKIICPIHGEFFITPNHHGRGSGCRKCYRALWTKEEISFLRKNYLLYGADFCAEKLNKSIRAVNIKAHKSKISEPRKRYVDNSIYSYEGIDRKYFANIKSNARKRQIEFNIIPEDIWNVYIAQEKKCALTGFEVSFKIKNNKFRTASIDRIDSSKGYTNDNIQIVCKIANRLKMDMSEEELLDLCKIVIQYHQISGYEKAGILLL